MGEERPKSSSLLIKMSEIIVPNAVLRSVKSSDVARYASCVPDALNSERTH